MIQYDTLQSNHDTSTKAELTEAILLPLRNPHVGWNEILIHGSPGVGKTYLTKEILTNHTNNTPIFYTTGHNLKQHNSSSSDSESIYQLFEKARLNRPSVLYIDDLEGICDWSEQTEHDKQLLRDFLQLMHDRESGVLVLGATGVPWRINPAVIKIFQRRFHIPLPNKERRIEILKECFLTEQHDLQNEDFEEVALLTDGYSYSDLVVLSNGARMNNFRSVFKAANNNMNLITNIGVNYIVHRKGDLINALFPSSSISKQEEDQHLQFQHDSPKFHN